MLNFGVGHKADIVFVSYGVYMIPELMQKKDLKSALLVIDPFMIDVVYKKLADQFDVMGIRYVLFDDIGADCPDDKVTAAAELAKANDVDCIIGIGGGAALDTAKAVNILIHTDRPLWAYVEPGTVQEPGAYLILASTTAGTGSEVTNGAVIEFAALGRKIGIGGDNPQADLAIVDPMLTATMPPRLTAITGIDAFTHAASSLTSKLSIGANILGNQNLFSEMQACEAIRQILEYLPRAFKDGSDKIARERMAFAANIAGQAFFDKPPHVDHSIGHAIGAEMGVPHGEACGMSMPLAIRFVADTAPEGIRKLADVMGVSVKGKSNAEAAEAVASAIDDFYSQFGLRHIKDLEMTDQQIDNVAQKAIEDVTAMFCTRTLSKANIIQAINDDIAGVKLTDSEVSNKKSAAKK